MDTTKAMIRQHLYWTEIRDAVHKEVTNCDNCQRTKQSNKKYGKSPDKLDEEINWYELFVDLIGPYATRRKGKKEILHLKDVTMINPVTE